MTKLKSGYETAVSKPTFKEETTKKEPTKKSSEKIHSISSKDLEKRYNVRNVFPSKLIEVAQIYAEDGLVWVQMKDGSKKVFKVEEAAKRCKSLIAMNEKIKVMKPSLVNSHFELVNKITEACYKAQEQKGNHFKSHRTKNVQRFVNHTNADGSPIDETSFTDKNMEHYIRHYDLLKTWEIEMVLKSKYPSDIKKKLLTGMQMKRYNAKIVV